MAITRGTDLRDIHRQRKRITTRGCAGAGLDLFGVVFDGGIAGSRLALPSGAVPCGAEHDCCKEPDLLHQSPP